MLAHSGSYVQLWTITNKGAYYRFNDVNSEVNSMCFSSDGEKLCLGFNSEFLQIIDLYTGQISSLETASPSVNIVRSCPNNDLFVVGSKTGPITLLNSKNQKSVFRGHKFAITATAFTSNNRTLISGDKHGSISVLADLKKPSKLPNWSSKNGTIFDISMAKQANSMAVACGEQLAFYDFNEMKVINFLDFGLCRQIKYSPYTDSLIAIATQAGDLYLFDPNSNIIVNQISFNNPIASMDFRFDGCTLAVGVDETGVNLVDIRKIETEINSIELFPDKKKINSIVFQPFEINKPLFSEFADEMVVISKVSGKKTLKKENLPKNQSNSKNSISNPDLQNSSEIFDENNYSNMGSILNSSSFEFQSLESENIEVKSLTQNDDQVSLVKVAQEINKPKQNFEIVQGLNFDFESPKPIKNRNNDQNVSPNNIDLIINNFYADILSNMKDELHEHSNKFHIDIIQKLHEIDESINQINYQIK